MSESGGNYVNAVWKGGSTAFASSNYGNIEGNLGVRPPMNRDGYEYFRPNEAVPLGRNQEELRKIMSMCRASYERVGVIRSVVDMMSEFGAEGIEILHEDTGPNNFYKAWSQKVNLEDRVERFLSWYYKAGNVVVRRNFGTLSTNSVKKISSVEFNDADGRIPVSYVFYNPATVELVGGGIGALSKKKVYAIRVPFSFFDGIRHPRTPLEKEVFKALPVEIQEAANGKTQPGELYLLPIPTDKIHVAYYKKDDCDIWGKSFIYSILEDIIYNDKVKLAKLSGLDGFYNTARIWKLGDHTISPAMIPSPDEYEKLIAILQANTGGGPMDVVWNSAIDCQELYPPVEKLANFEENIHNILLGLGVPENLVGGQDGKSSSSTGDYLGLKNLIKRLEAGRRAVTTWLNEEIDIIQKGMGFRKRPIIRFAHADLHDERTYFNLLVQLLDRNVISDRTVLERINEIPEIEKRRVKDEADQRESGSYPDKASPFHKPDLEQQQQHELKKIKEQKKVVPGAGGGGNGPDNSSNVQRRTNREPRRKGRPLNSPDTVKRKRGANKVRSPVGAMTIEANRLYDIVDSYVKNFAVSHFGVANLRQLSNEQDSEMDKIKVAIFAQIPPFTKSSDETLEEYLNDLDEVVFEEFRANYNQELQDVGAEDLNNEQKKLLRINAYINTWLDDGV